MSNLDVHSVLTSIKEAADAYERLPQLETQISDLNLDLAKAQGHAMGLESNIIGYKSQIEELNAKVRSLEVERDDASFRALEADDNAHNILTLVQNAASALDQVIEKLDPPKPLLDPMPVVNEVGPSAPDPTECATSSNPTPLQVAGGPYSGKRWSEVFPRVYIKSDWFAGGGDQAGWDDNYPNTYYPTIV